MKSDRQCIHELYTLIEKLQAQVTNLRGGWTDIEIKRASLVSSEYWFITDHGVIFSSKKRNGKVYEFRKKAGNVFESKEEAQQLLDRIKNRKGV